MPDADRPDNRPDPDRPNEPRPDRVRSFPRAVATISTLVVLGLIGFSLVMWFALPLSLRETFTLFQRLTLIAVLVAIAVLLGATSASYVVADADGVRLRNGLHTHVYRWEDVRRVDFEPGDAWVHLWIRPDDQYPEGVRRYVLGIMRVDGERAEQAVDGLRALHRAARPTER
ncbi:hypothetical protein FHX74_002931 [Friedmanniella endophytica]|uniref:Low molecular weight protein antigen 6 PH domain-containing protein n=1 Tax=Microlunatus kandeliicorticis TaxID=1759536 RepID=A0A7W3IU70_9ACTN|nr:PH domain-containing protein [Microlunatus kandeliicorticis]MBA8795303.1 hypothetical protein [Microlunatus kandeliicorticis]